MMKRLFSLLVVGLLPLLAGCEMVVFQPYTSGTKHYGVD